jgi:hypothetical protein
MEGNGKNKSESDKDKFKNTEIEISFHADEHNQSVVDVPESRPMERSGGTGNENDKNEKKKR